MKKLPTQVVEVENEGLVALLGQRITVYCSAYIYCGTLDGVNDTCVKLKDAVIVYDTGSFSAKGWVTAEKFPGKGEWYIQLSAIESFGLLKE